MGFDIDAAPGVYLSLSFMTIRQIPTPLSDRKNPP